MFKNLVIFIFLGQYLCTNYVNMLKNKKHKNSMNFNFVDIQVWLFVFITLKPDKFIIIIFLSFLFEWKYNWWVMLLDPHKTFIIK